MTSQKKNKFFNKMLDLIEEETGMSIDEVRKKSPNHSFPEREKLNKEIDEINKDKKQYDFTKK